MSIQKSAAKLLAALLALGASLQLTPATAALLPFEGVQVTREPFTALDGVTRQITYFRPLNAAPNAPAVFVLHYNLASAQPMANLTEVGQLARDFGTWIIMPTAEGLSWATDPNRTAATEPDHVSFLAELIDHVVATRGIDARRVYMTGYSDGGNMSVRFACTRPEKIAAAGAVGATMRRSQANLGRCAPSLGTPFIYIMGTEDAQVLYEPNILTDPVQIIGCNVGVRCNLSAPSAAEHWAGVNQCNASPTRINLPDTVNDGTTVYIDRYSGCARNALVELYTIVNGGHTWPGSLDFAPRAGITSQDINATRVLWNFFRQFSR